MDYITSIVELAKEIEKEDSIDWGLLSVDEDDTYHLLASQLVEKYESLVGIEEERIVLLATILKLIVENFVLNLKLLQE